MDDNFDRFEQRASTMIDTTAPAAQTVANAALPKAGGTMTGLVVYASAQPRLVQSATQVATSGTALTFSGIPSWATRISLGISALSVAPTGGVGTSSGPIILRLGTSSSVEGTGYAGSSATNNATSGATCSHDPADAAAKGINLIGVATSIVGGADIVISGEVVLTLIDPATNLWASRAVLGFSSNAQTSFAAGSKALGGTLDRLQLNCSTGNSFDGGKVSITYEG